ncbi:MAG: TraR/DksA C4-type zinc finger protein [Balneolaceae bacterium]
MAEQKEKFRTQLSEDELDHFKQKLEEAKKETEKEIENLKSSADSINANADDRRSGTHHHFGNVSAENQMKKTTYELLQKQRDKLQKINAAFERMEIGTYGICVVTGKPIQKERLEIMPYAMHSIEAKKGGSKGGDKIDTK